MAATCAASSRACCASSDAMRSRSAALVESARTATARTASSASAALASRGPRSPKKKHVRQSHTSLVHLSLGGRELVAQRRCCGVGARQRHARQLGISECLRSAHAQKHNCADNQKHRCCSRLRIALRAAVHRPRGRQASIAAQRAAPPPPRVLARSRQAIDTRTHTNARRVSDSATLRRAHRRVRSAQFASTRSFGTLCQTRVALGVGVCGHARRELGAQSLDRRRVRRVEHLRVAQLSLQLFASGVP